MKKNRLLTLLVLLCLLLSACGGTAGPEPAEESPSPAAAPEEPAAAPEPSPAVTEASPEPEPVAEDIEGIFPLLEKDGVTLTLIISLEPDFARTEVYLNLSVPEEEGYHYQVTNLTINGKLRLDQTVYTSGYYPNSSTRLELGQFFSQGLLRLEDFRQFSCHIRKYTWTESGESTVTIWEEDCETQIPEAFRPNYVFLPCFGAKAEKQVLLDDGRILVTLLGMGKEPGSSSDQLSCLLRAENLSDHSFPFKLSGFSVNGIFLPSYGRTFYLSPGSICYCYEEVSNGTLSGNDISDINTVSFLLLTDLSEDKGVFSLSGGTWYPVDLSQSGEGGSEPEYREILFENDWIRVAYVDQSETPPYSETGNMHYSWRLVVWNLSESDLQLRYYLDEDDCFCYLSNPEIQAGNWRYVTVNASLPYGSERPKLAVPLQGFTVGGGKLLFPETEPIPLPNE